MNWKNYAGLFILGLLVFGAYSIKVSVPGYMDAEYYFAMGLRIVKEGVFSEPFLWNYLHPLQDLPRPGFTYWMPLPALLSAIGLALSGSTRFAGAQVGMVVVAAFIPVITMRLAYQLTGNRANSWLAAGLALVPIFYSPFLVTTDSFGILMVLGGLFMVVVEQKKGGKGYLLLGLLSGLMHLARADGFIWLAVGLGIALISDDKRFSRAGLVIAGYLCIMTGWFARNYFSLGELMPSGSLRTLWLREYNELFSYYPERLNFQGWLGQGSVKIAGTILSALAANVKTAIFVNGQLIMAPVIGYGLWLNRGRKSVTAGIAASGIIFAVMTVLFPYAGMRGGFLHSAAALQPLFWATAAIGFTAFVAYGAKIRNWEIARSRMIFGATLIVILAGVTAGVYWERVIGDDFQEPHWSRSYRVAVEVAERLDELGATSDSLVMINNPPGFYIASDMSSIVIPNEGLDEIIQAGEKFEIDYFVLEENHPESLTELYQDPGKDPRLGYLGTERGIRYFLFP